MEISNKMKINKSGKRLIIATFVLLIIQTSLLFIAAGKVNIWRFWAFVIVNILYTILATLILYRINQT